MSEPEQDVRVDIQRTLASINDITIKIKKELTMILDLIKEEGRLDTAARDANELVSNVLQDLGIDITADRANGEENEEQVDSLLMPVTPDLITTKLSSLIEDTEVQSQ